ncbi:hypothetical protein RRG08_033111 [Elysia crispata]|uniref:Uncharacterized protein n=1 Tax=Elysia crispata TaxID=231223 RepID=A0AAE1ED21_9GAST|nr:hypothetical protein RRG08_033111 [Elysia crispata]
MKRRQISRQTLYHMTTGTPCYVRPETRCQSMIYLGVTRHEGHKQASSPDVALSKTTIRSPVLMKQWTPSGVLM